MKSLRLSSSRLLILALALAACGCSTGKEGFEKDLDAMKRELSQMRATSLALQDRIEALEDGAEDAPADADLAEADAPGSDRPNLEVVHLMPEADDEALPAEAAPEAAPDDEPPTVIRNNARGVPEIQDPNKPRWRRR